MGKDSGTYPFVAFVLGIVCLAFIGGALATAADVPPGSYIRDAYRAGSALFEKRLSGQNHYKQDIWNAARTDERGVTSHDPDRVAPGLTLYTSGHASSALLIDAQGRVRHGWERPFSSIHDDTAAVRSPVPDRQVYFRRTHLYPDGDLLAVMVGVGDSPWGYGMVRLGPDSGIVWKNLDRFHHDFAIAQDGRIYGLTHQYRSDFPPALDHLSDPALDDHLTIVSPEGHTLRKISLLDALERSPFRDLLRLTPAYAREDPLHTNAIDLLSKKEAQRLASKLPVAKEGQILLSFRELAGGVIALLDPKEKEIVWAQRGQWQAQHDPDVLQNGNILLFDNLGDYEGKGPSRVVEVDPETGGIVWSYDGPESRPLGSAIRSAQQLLPNGNLLITESDGGRLLEVTRDGETVWEYVNPVRGGDQDQYIPVVNWAQRIDPAGLGTAFRARVTGENLARE